MTGDSFTFAVQEVRRGPRSLDPSVSLRLALSLPGEVVSGQIVAQVRFEPRRRAWSEAETLALRPVFGPPALWSRSTGSLLWAQVSVAVPTFADHGVAELHLPVNTSLDHAMGKLLALTQSGEFPIAVALRGMLFRRQPGGLAAFPVPQDHEVAGAVPIALLDEALSETFGERRVLDVDRATFDRLQRAALAHSADLDGALRLLLDRFEGSAG